MPSPQLPWGITSSVKRRTGFEVFRRELTLFPIPSLTNLCPPPPAPNSPLLVALSYTHIISALPAQETTLTTSLGKRGKASDVVEGQRITLTRTHPHPNPNPKPNLIPNPKEEKPSLQGNSVARKRQKHCFTVPYLFAAITTFVVRCHVAVAFELPCLFAAIGPSIFVPISPSILSWHWAVALLLPFRSMFFAVMWPSLYRW